MGAQATMVAADSAKSPDEMPPQLPDTELQYITSFDHEPTEAELEFL